MIENAETKRSQCEVLPFFHIYGMVLLLLAGSFVGAKVVVMPKFVPDKYVQLIVEQKVHEAVQLALDFSQPR